MGEEIFVDANIFLEIFLKDVKSEYCKNLFRISQNVQLLTSDFIVYSCFINIQNNLKNNSEIGKAILFFNNIPNLKILRPSFDEFYSAVGIMETEKLDFDDSLVVACMRNYGIKELASLDKHFDKVKEIKRMML